ncbi:MAG TPA: hypothetical protein VI006_08785 [Solirubrobacteraceae bacterium]
MIVAPLGGVCGGDARSPGRGQLLDDDLQADRDRHGDDSATSPMISPAMPPDTLPTPLVMSPTCSLSVSSAPLPPLMSSPSSLCLTLSTICGRSSLKSRTASLIACATTRTTAPDDDHDRQHEHDGAQPAAPAQPSLHHAHHRHEGGGAEDRDEDHEQHVRDRRWHSTRN